MGIYQPYGRWVDELIIPTMVSKTMGVEFRLDPIAQIGVGETNKKKHLKPPLVGDEHHLKHLNVGGL